MTAVLRVDVELSLGPLRVVFAAAVDPRGLVLVGPNGAGKTSTLLALLGLRRPRRGRVTIDDQVLLDTASGRELPPERRQLGYVPQDDALFPHLTAAGNVAFALACARRPPRRAARDQRARELLATLGVDAATADRLPEALSGGSRQRVALARALAAAPLALLLDEPFAALDAETRPAVRAFVARELATLGRPYIVVTHDAADAAAIGAPVAVMEAGRIVQTGELAELARAPATPYVASFTAAHVADRAPG